MEPKFYVVERIEGDYAYIKEKETGEVCFVALALLPEGADVGDTLRGELFSYTFA